MSEWFVLSRFDFAALAVLPVVIFHLLLLAQHRWQKVRGTITRSEVEPIAHLPIIRYRFEVNGQPFTGDQVWSADATDYNEGSAQWINLRYPVGKDVDVFVHPSDPLKSVLQPGGNPQLVITMYAVLAGAVAAIFFLF